MGNAADMGFAVRLQVLPESLWGQGRVCVPCVAYVAVYLWKCLWLSDSAHSPGCFRQGEEEPVQPLLFTFYSEVSACGCSPGPASFSEAHVGLDMGQTAPRHASALHCAPPAQHPLLSLGAMQG